MKDTSAGISIHRQIRNDGRIIPVIGCLIRKVPDQLRVPDSISAFDGFSLF